MPDVTEQFHEFTDQEISDPAFSAHWLAGYLSSHFADGFDPFPTISYVSQVLNFVDADLAEATIRDPGFVPAGSVIVQERDFLPKREVPVAVDYALRYRWTEPARPARILGAYADLAWSLHPDSDLPTSPTELLFIASRAPRNPGEEYLRRLDRGIRQYFSTLSPSQLDHIFDAENSLSLDVLRSRYQSLLDGGGPKALARLYLLSFAVLPELTETLRARIASDDYTGTTTEARTLNLFWMVKNDLIRALAPASIQAPPRRWSNWAVLARRPRPKVAICISGQMRGYQSAYPTWQEALQLDDIEASVFVSTWRGVGNKDLTSAHMDRHFPKTLAAQVSTRWVQLGAPTFRSRFPTICAMVENGLTVTADDLRDYYGTEHVIVHDDDAIPQDFSNQERMLFKIEDAWELARASGERFDLALRIRPDKILESVDGGLAWRELADWLTGGRRAYSDFAPQMRVHQGLAVGDQFLLAGAEIADVLFRPMPNHRLANRIGPILGMPPDIAPHGVLGGTVAVAGIEVRRMPGLALENRNLVGPRNLTADEIAAAFEADRTPETDADVTAFLVALRADAPAD